MAHAAASNAALGSGDSAELATEPGHWTKTHTPAVAGQATKTQAAGGVGVRHICRALSATISCGATPQTPILVNLIDGASGGTPLASWALSAPANAGATIQLTDLSIVGSPATAMTLEFAGVGVANSQQTVNVSGFDVSG